MRRAVAARVSPYCQEDLFLRSCLSFERELKPIERAEQAVNISFSSRHPPLKRQLYFGMKGVGMVWVVGVVMARVGSRPIAETAAVMGGEEEGR